MKDTDTCQLLAKSNVNQNQEIICFLSKTSKVYSVHVVVAFSVSHQKLVHTKDRVHSDIKSNIVYADKCGEECCDL